MENLNKEQSKKYIEIAKSGNMDLMFDFGREVECISFMKEMQERANKIPPNLLLNEIVNCAYDRKKLYENTNI